MAEKIGSLEFDIIGIDNISEVVEASKAKIQGLVDSTVKGSTKMDESFNKIKDEFKKAFGQVDTVIDTNIAEIKKLEAEYTKLSTESGKAFQSGKDDDYRRIQARQEVLKSEIATRKQLVSEASKSNTELASLEEKVAAKVKVNAGAQKQLRTQLMLAREELAKMEAAGQRGTAAYEKLQVATAKMTDQYKDATRQANILANDERGFQGIITGLGGISGAMSAAAGAYGLFAGENENLQKIMTKVQSLMAITIGLQQISQTVNKDSAFMLVTVNGLKKWWNEITGKSVVVETAEAVATKAATASKKGQTTEILKGTAATAGNTAATTTGTVATKGLAGGFKAVGLAIKSIPGIGWLLLAVTAIIAAFTLLNKKQKEAREEQMKFNKSLAEAATQPVAKIYELSASFEALGNDMKAKEKFIRDNANAFKELGLAVKTVADAERILIEQKDAVIDATIMKAKASVMAKEAEQRVGKLLEVQGELAIARKEKTQLEADYKRTGIKHFLVKIKEKQDEIEALEKYEYNLNYIIKSGYKKAAKAIEEGEKMLKEAGVGTTEEFDVGTIAYYQNEIRKLQDLQQDAKSHAAYKKYQNEIDAYQKQIDAIQGKGREKTDDPFLDKIQKQKAVYDQIAKDLTSTDDLVVQSAKDKYETIKEEGESYLKYLQKEREKIIGSGKELSKTQKKNLETLNKEISDLTQKENGKDNTLLQYSYTLQKEKIIQKYQKDIEDIQSKVGTVDIETGLTVTQKEVDEAVNYLKNKKNKELEDLMNSFYPKTDFQALLNEYADFEQQRNAIAKKYKDIRDKMHEQNASDIKAGVPVTFKDENFKAVDTSEATALAEVNKKEIEDLVRGSIKLSNIFTDIQFLSKQTAKQTIGDIKSIYAYLDSGKTTELQDDLKDYADKIISDPQKLAEFYNNARALQEEYVNETANPFDNIIFAVEQLSESYKHLENVENEATEEGKRYENQQAKISRDKGVKMLGQYAVTAANGLQQMATYMREYAEASGDVNLEQQAESLSGFANDLSAAGEGAQSGQWVGAIIGYIGSLLTRELSGIVQTQIETAKLETALKDVANAAREVNNELLLSGENRENIFGTDVYGKYLDAVELYKKAERDLAASLDELTLSITLGDVEEDTGLVARGVAKSYKKALEKGYDGLELMQIKTKDRGDFLEGIGFTDKYTSLKDLYPKLFNSDGSLNIDQLKAFKGNEELWGKLTKEQQDYFDSVLSNSDLMNEALNAQQEYLSSLFGSLGDDISNAFWQAATEGTNAMETIGDSIDEIVAKWIQQQAYMMFIQPVFDEIEKNMNSLRGQQKREGDKWVEYSEEDILEYGTQSLYNRLNKVSGGYKEFVESTLENLGIASDKLEANTLSGAIKGASQESIDLLAGQTNAVRLNQVEGLQISRSHLFHLVSIDSGVQQIVQIMKSNNVNNAITTDPMRGKGITTL